MNNAPANTAIISNFFIIAPFFANVLFSVFDTAIDRTRIVIVAWVTGPCESKSNARCVPNSRQLF